jgi:prepilin-type N-terminal cleavage/methylation domain-containing protein
MNRPQRSAFTLVELLVTIAIIVVVIALLFPAFNTARIVAKNTATTQLVQDLQTATSTFMQDNQRMPGYFAADQVGGIENVGSSRRAGLSTMENIMLDLAGGVITTGGNDVIEIQLASGDPLTYVNPDLIGSEAGFGGGTPYFSPPDKFYPSGEVLLKDLDGNGQNAGPEIRNRLPDLVDSYGTPILAWAKDERARGDVVAGRAPAAGEVPFAAEHYDPAVDEPAWFYWRQNASFVTGTSVGKKLIDQNEESLLGTAHSSPAERVDTMVAMLGHPSFITSDTEPIDFSTPAARLGIYPTDSRGDIVFHTAGPDGVYMSNRAKRSRAFYEGGGSATDPADKAVFGYAFDADGQPFDIGQAFDDTFKSSGN